MVFCKRNNGRIIRCVNKFMRLESRSNESSILKLPTPNEECKNLLNLAKIKWPKFIIGGAIVLAPNKISENLP